MTNSEMKENSVLTNIFIVQICQTSTKINPAITNPGNGEQKWPVPNCPSEYFPVAIKIKI